MKNKLFPFTFSMLFIGTVCQAAVISGTIRFEGEAPAAQELNMAADPNCLEFHGGEDVFNPQVLVGEQGGLKNVFVYIKKGVPEDVQPVPDASVVLDQKGCLFEPRVAGIRAGQNLEMMNSDETLHNVNAQAEKQKRFNIGLPMQGMKMTRSFKETEVMVMIKCDVHPWMRAYVGVLKHPYFDVTGLSGSFEIEGLDPGIYEIEIWHEVFGRQTREVVLKDESLTEDFVYRA